MSLNSVILTGRLTADPELRTTTTRKDVTTFDIAVDRPFVKDGEQGADFFTIVAWEKKAQFVTRYFKKGSPIAIQGKLQTRSYTTKDGAKRTAVEVLALEVDFFGGKKESSDRPQTSQAPGYSAAPDFEEIADDEDVPF